MNLRQGEKKSLADLGLGNRLNVKVDFGLEGVDIAAFGLNAARQIGDDRYVVLFSNLQAPGGSIVLRSQSDSANFDLDLDRLPPEIDRVVFTATHDTRPIADSRPLTVSLDGLKATFNVAEHLSTEKAVMMIEIYRHSGGWRCGTIAAGFAGGLEALVRHFGGDVANSQASASSSTPAPIPTPKPVPTPPPAPAPVPQAPRVSLSKVTLEKSKPTISLKKEGATFGEIILNLNWSQAPQKRGLFGGSKPLDLDLGVLFELRDGSKGCIQALGQSFGYYDIAPYIELSGDDRTGAIAAGETIRINGRYFDEIVRIGVFALIYDGAPNWQQTDGVVRMKIPGQPEVEVRMDEGRNDRRLCGISVVDNVNGEMKINRHMQYYPSQKEFADNIGIRLRWVAGSKD